MNKFGSSRVYRVAVFPQSSRWAGHRVCGSELRTASPVWFSGTRIELLHAADSLVCCRSRFAVECARSIRSAVNPTPWGELGAGSVASGSNARV